MTWKNIGSARSSTLRRENSHYRQSGYLVAGLFRNSSPLLRCSSTTGIDKAESLAHATNIDKAILRHTFDPQEWAEFTLKIDSYSVAQRMSWVAGRQTTKPEDRAYSLLGIFFVTMPTWYGEGWMFAFRRLQEEIMKITADQSIFAWNSDIYSSRCLLAESPDCFSDCSNIIPRYSLSDVSAVAFFMNNRGMQIRMATFRPRAAYEMRGGCRHYQAILNYRSATDPSPVYLLNLYESRKDEYYFDRPGERDRCESIDWAELRLREKQKQFSAKEAPILKYPPFKLDTETGAAINEDNPYHVKLRLPDLLLRVCKVYHEDLWFTGNLLYTRYFTEVFPNTASAGIRLGRPPFKGNVLVTFAHVELRSKHWHRPQACF